LAQNWPQWRGPSGWEYTFNAEGDLPETHEKRNLATPSPATDSEIVYAWFSSGQLVAVDMNGSWRAVHRLAGILERSDFHTNGSNPVRHRKPKTLKLGSWTGTLVSHQYGPDCGFY
jgi:hypothetical protein